MFPLHPLLFDIRITVLVSSDTPLIVYPDVRVFLGILFVYNIGFEPLRLFDTYTSNVS